MMDVAPSWSFFLIFGLSILPPVVSQIDILLFGGEWNYQDRILWVLAAGTVGTLLCRPFYRYSSPEYRRRVENLFVKIRTPIDYEKEVGVNRDSTQLVMMGKTAIVGGTFLSALLLVPNDPAVWRRLDESVLREIDQAVCGPEPALLRADARYETWPGHRLDRAMQEVTGPVIGIALVLSAVFVPTAFIPGITGRLYQQFARRDERARADLRGSHAGRNGLRIRRHVVLGKKSTGRRAAIGHLRHVAALRLPHPGHTYCVVERFAASHRRRAPQGVPAGESSTVI